MAARGVGRRQRTVDDEDVGIAGARIEADFQRLEDLREQR